MDTRYLSSLKTALFGAPRGRLVFVCNFEVETHWARGHVGLPSPGFSTSAEIVRRMEELGVLLAGPHDAIVLKQSLDDGYRSYLEDLGLPVPTVLVPECVEPGRSTTEDALASPLLLARLAALAQEGARLMPMGTSAAEQRLAEACAMPLAVPDAATFERVNGKVYGRRLVEAAGLRPVPGRCCADVDGFAAVLAGYRPLLADGGRVVVKDSFGVSGKGLVVLDGPAKADRLLRMVQRRAAKDGEQRLDVVVEEWLPKQCDLNYQATIGRDGEVTLDFVKRALTENGVHKGHLMPAGLTPGQEREIAQAAQAVGRRLFADGFAGVIGVDAILGEDDLIYPVLEINARLNMSTYQGSVLERLQPEGHAALARHYPLRLSSAVKFDDLRRVLGPVLDLRDDERFVVTCFGTANANARRPAPFEGRLYALLIAPDRERLRALDAAAQTAVAQLSATMEDVR